jgi:phage terminase large subunit
VDIALPFQFEPRSYQARAMNHFDRGGTRGAYVWSRKSGKDTTFVHQTCKMAHERRGQYFHLLPTFAQAKRVIWNYIDDQGRRLIDQAFPPPLRDGVPNETDLLIKLRCGSMWQLLGADNFDAAMGSNPVGIVFSEYATTDPRSWQFFRPILMQNKGWAAFISTPRGYNHFHEMCQIARREPGWDYSEVDAIAAGTMSMEDVEREIREGMPEELARQEYLIDFSAANVGAILGSRVERAEKEGRIRGDVEADSDGAEICVSSDIGYTDQAAWWWWQARPDGIALLHYEEDFGLDADDWIQRLPEAGFKIKRIFLPHDAKAKTFATKHSVLERFMAAGRQMGWSVQVVPKTAIVDRINAARTVMAGCHFHIDRCAQGLTMLRSWAFKYNEETKQFSREPDHNFASHGGDAFSYGAQMLREHVKVIPSRPRGIEVPSQGLHYMFSLNDLERTVGKARYIRS